MSSRTALWLQLSRPFTLLAPALGVVSGGDHRRRGRPPDLWTANLLGSRTSSTRVDIGEALWRNKSETMAEQPLSTRPEWSEA
jgi:hypothetical protein